MEKVESETQDDSGDETKDHNPGNDDVINDVMVLVFKFCCPKCGKNIRASQQTMNNSESTYFSLSNIERHLLIHAPKNQPKKVKKSKNDKKVVCKPKKRALRSKTNQQEAVSSDSESYTKNMEENKDVSCNDEYEILTDKETDDEGPGDFKIVPKRKISTHRKN